MDPERPYVEKLYRITLSRTEAVGLARLIDAIGDRDEAALGFDATPLFHELDRALGRPVWEDLDLGEIFAGEDDTRYCIEVQFRGQPPRPLRANHNAEGGVVYCASGHVLEFESLTQAQRCEDAVVRSIPENQRSHYSFRVVSA